MAQTTNNPQPDNDAKHAFNLRFHQAHKNYWRSLQESKKAEEQLRQAERELKSALYNRPKNQTTAISYRVQFISGDPKPGADNCPYLMQCIPDELPVGDQAFLPSGILQQQPQASIHQNAFNGFESRLNPPSAAELEFPTDSNSRIATTSATTGTGTTFSHFLGNSDKTILSNASNLTASISASATGTGAGGANINFGLPAHDQPQSTLTSSQVPGGSTALRSSPFSGPSNYQQQTTQSNESRMFSPGGNFGGLGPLKQIDEAGHSHNRHPSTSQRGGFHQGSRNSSMNGSTAPTRPSRAPVGRQFRFDPIASSSRVKSGEKSREEAKSPNNLVCNICGKQCETRWKLEDHQVSHDPSKKHPCPGCGKGFKHERDMRKHIKLKACHSRENTEGPH